MLYGGISFSLVSVLAYSIWAFRLIPGTAAMYSTIAAVYLGLAGFALSRLISSPKQRKRFPLLFAIGFFLYAICWCAFWFGLRGKYQADLWGAAVGLAAMAWIIRRPFEPSVPFLAAFGALFTFHTLGYTLGEELYAVIRGSTGRLMWGAAHGAGFGAGLGYLLFHCRPVTPDAVTSRPVGTSNATSVR
jgi:hypothetical protein